VIEENRVNLDEISSNALIAEQRRESEIVSKLKDFSLAEDIAKTNELRAEVLYRKIQSTEVVPRSFGGLL